MRSEGICKCQKQSWRKNFYSTILRAFRQKVKPWYFEKSRQSGYRRRGWIRIDEVFSAYIGISRKLKFEDRNIFQWQWLFSTHRKGDQRQAGGFHLFAQYCSASRILFILSSSCECGDSTRRARGASANLFTMKLDSFKESGQRSRVGIRFTGVAACDDNERRRTMPRS